MTQNAKKTKKKLTGLLTLPYSIQMKNKFNCTYALTSSVFQCKSLVQNLIKIITSLWFRTLEEGNATLLDPSATWFCWRKTVVIGWKGQWSGHLIDYSPYNPQSGDICWGWALYMNKNAKVNFMLHFTIFWDFGLPFYLTTYINIPLKRQKIKVVLLREMRIQEKQMTK